LIFRIVIYAASYGGCAGVLRLMSGMAAGCPTRDARRAPFMIDSVIQQLE